MNLSLRAKVFSVSTAGIATTVAMGVVAYLQFGRISSNQDEMAVAQSALRNQLEADMMHDALRADVLSALRIAARKDDAARPEVLTNLAEHVETFRARIRDNEALPVAPAVRTAFRGVKAPLDQYIQSAEEIVTLAFQDAAAAEGQFAGFTEKFEALETQMGNVSDVIEQSSKDLNAVNDALVRQFLPVVGGTVGAGAVVLFILSVVVARSIPRPFQKLIEELASLSNAVDAASGEVAGASQTLAEGAGEQAASLEETSASLEEMTSMVKRNAEAADKAKMIANQTRTAADTGSSDMTEMKTAMNEIKVSSSEVAKIVREIDEIAFQTNILALNAAVEAARAGEAGAGFAVVADEVRNLAQRSALSARETAEKIEAAIAKSERGVQISNKVASNFESIVTKTREVDQYVAEIATASQEQAQGVSQVNVAVSQMDKVTQSNAATAEESAAAAAELRAQAASVKEVVLSLERLVVGTASRPGGGPAPSQPPLPPLRPEKRSLPAAAASSLSVGTRRNRPEPVHSTGTGHPVASGDGFKDF